MYHNIERIKYNAVNRRQKTTEDNLFERIDLIIYLLNYLDEKTRNYPTLEKEVKEIKTEIKKINNNFHL